MASSSAGVFQRLIYKINESKDPAGLGIARFLFGLLMIIDIFDERGLTHLPEKYGDPDSCYFPLFDGLPRLPLEYMHLVYFIMIVASLFIMIGFFYKISCICFVVCYWYIFFLDKTVWNNHSYLYGLLSIQLLLCNANYYWSVDGLLWPSIRNKAVPSWQYGLLRFQLFLLYFFAGLKKLDREWLHGYSMSGLSSKWIFDPFRMFLSDENIDYIMVHLCGLFFDLSQGFLLFFDQTRIIGFFFGYMFHGMNAVMFNIGMFSYMCMAMMPIFCRPDWPKTLICKCPKTMQLLLPLSNSAQENSDCSSFVLSEDKDKKESNDIKKSKGTKDKKNRKKEIWNWSFKTIFFNVIVLNYVVIQLMLPYSHFITKGYNSWTQGLYGYSWDMMIHSWSTQHVVVKVVDEVNQNKQYLRPGAFFPFGNDKNRIFSHPDMMKQYALCLADRIKEMPDLNISKPQIYFDVWKAMNQRYQQRMIDPNVDIVKAPWSVFEQTTWIRPLLVELNSWRSTLTKIRSINYESNNATDIVFVADFPGLFLENYIAPEIKANVTVLLGKIIVQTEEDKNFTVSVNETFTLDSDTTHTIHTVTEDPSCYMYIYYNTTWIEQTQEQLIASDPTLERTKKANDEWKSKNIVEKFQFFMHNKLRKFQQGIYQIYFALSVIFDYGPGENDGIISDEL